MDSSQRDISAELEAESTVLPRLAGNRQLTRDHIAPSGAVFTSPPPFPLPSFRATPPDPPVRLAPLNAATPANSPLTRHLCLLNQTLDLQILPFVP